MAAGGRWWEGGAGKGDAACLAKRRQAQGLVEVVERRKAGVS